MEHFIGVFASVCSYLWAMLPFLMSEMIRGSPGFLLAVGRKHQQQCFIMPQTHTHTHKTPPQTWFQGKNRNSHLDPAKA